jgi:adenylate kinase family enzyme
MSTKKIFVVGRPGSGKTTAVRHFLKLAERRSYNAYRVRDYDILYEMFRREEDTPILKDRKFRPTDYGGFDVLDNRVFDTALDQLNKYLDTLKVAEKSIITVEFARDDYKKAMALFSPKLLQDAYFFFVDSSLDICIDRIKRRIKYPPQPDYHFVSEFIMKTYYNTENMEYMQNRFKNDFGLTKEVMAYSNSGSLDELIEKVNELADIIFGHKDPDSLSDSNKEVRDDKIEPVQVLGRVCKADVESGV